MNKESLMYQRATEIAHAIVGMTEENEKEREIPFTPGWQDKMEDLMPLIENIVELMKHPRKNAEILYFLNQLTDSYYL